MSENNILKEQVNKMLEYVHLAQRLGVSSNVAESIEEISLFLDVLHAVQRYLEFKQTQASKKVP